MQFARTDLANAHNTLIWISKHYSFSCKSKEQKIRNPKSTCVRRWADLAETTCNCSIPHVRNTLFKLLPTPCVQGQKKKTKGGFHLSHSKHLQGVSCWSKELSLTPHPSATFKDGVSVINFSLKRYISEFMWDRRKGHLVNMIFMFIKILSTGTCNSLPWSSITKLPKSSRTCCILSRAFSAGV